MKKTIGIMLLTLALFMCSSVYAQESTFAPVVTLQAETSGVNQMVYPVISGLSDPEIEKTLNEKIYETLHIDDLKIRFERLKQSGESDVQGQGIHMDAKWNITGSIFSCVVSTQGEQHDGQLGYSNVTFNFDLKTGNEIAFADVFTDEKEAVSAMEDILSEKIIPDLNAYLENADVLPMPTDLFYLDENGITVFYDEAQFKFISGKSGECHFYFFEIDSYLNKENELMVDLFSADTADPVSAIGESVKGGKLGFFEFELGKPIGEYTQQHTLLSDPDYTMSSMVYPFEDANLRGLSLETALYAEVPEEQSPVVTIRSTRFDFYGIKTGVTSLEECEALLGEPIESATYDEDDAFDMLLEPGNSIFYSYGDNTLEIHVDDQDIVSCVLIHAPSY